MLRQPGIYGIHAVTSTNALHYAFRVGCRSHHTTDSDVTGAGVGHAVSRIDDEPEAKIEFA